MCVHREKKNVLLAIMKVIFPLSALTVFLFLAYLTHPGKRDGKSFLVFHSIQVFFFRQSLTKSFTLHSNKMNFFFTMDTRVYKQNMLVLFTEWKEEIYDTF